MKIAFFETKPWEKRLIKKKLQGHTLKIIKEPLTVENLHDAQDCDVVVTFIASHLTKDVLVKLPKLKMVATRSTGYDHIDVSTAKKRGVVVCNVPFYGENTVAEHTFALILSLSRKVHMSYVRSLQNDFSIEGLMGFDLQGKTLGVVGAGHIGMHVIRIARGFGMNVLAYDAYPNTFLAEVLGFEYVPFETVLKNAEIISLHVPYCTETHHLINKKNIHLIKKGALLINTARGGVVDTNALIEALDKHILSGAGLDVIEGEELIKEEKHLAHMPERVKEMRMLVKDHLLLSKENVVFTPHLAFYSKEALQRILETTVENILGFAAGKPKNVVT